MQQLEPVQEDNEDREEPEGLDELDDRGRKVSASPRMETMSYRDETRECTCASFLLMNSDQKELLEEVLSTKCHEVVVLDAVIKKIRKSLTETPGKNCNCKRGYSCLIIDTENMPFQLGLTHLLSQITPIYEKLPVEERESVQNIGIVVFTVENSGLNSPELLLKDAGEANIRIVQKPFNTD